MSLQTTVVPVTHFVKGHVVTGDAVRFDARVGNAAFTAPVLDLDSLVWRRAEPGPAFDIDIDEALSVLCALGDALHIDSNPFLREALQSTAAINPLDAAALEFYYRSLPEMFQRDRLEFEVEQSFGAAPGWRNVTDPRGGSFSVCPFPARLVHVMAGNTPGGASISVIRGALTRGVHLLKLPSNDLFTAPAILRTLAEIAPDHPLTRSFSAVYWRGGDETVERFIYRAQFFDKIIAWGGESAINNVVKYLGPGLELVAFDPKTSVSMIGNTAFDPDADLRHVAKLAADDVNNQQGCTNSRIQFVEGTVSQADDYCRHLVEELNDRRGAVGARPIPTPAEIRDAVEVLAELPGYETWGRHDGSGLVIRSGEPVDFELAARTVNVVPVTSLDDAISWINVATQTVGVYPPGRKRDLRDRLAAAGAQRIVALGGATLHGTANLGRPHDAFYPLQRFVRWIADEGEG